MIDFLGIGAQKAGTTWMFKHLSRHPRIMFPAGKEVHFWDQHYEKGVDYWLSKFPKRDKAIKQGEITPAYAILKPSLIQEVYLAAPSAKIFYILRNPIDRAWSSAIMALRRSEMLEEEASDQWFIDHFLSSGSRSRGQYLETIQAWTSIYPKDSFKIFFYDDILLEPRKLLEKVSSFIGVNTDFWKNVPEQVLYNVIVPDKPRKHLSKHLNVRVCRPELDSFLHKLYRYEIQELNNALNGQVSHWVED